MDPKEPPHGFLGPGDAAEIAHWLKFPNEPPRYKKNAGTDSDGYQHGEHGTNHRGLP
jgi:hypothetical protein